jgi:hypothetical protein
MDVRTEDVNYVILQNNGKPIVWETDGMPVIYGGIVDAEMDLREEDGEKIITLGEYAKSIGIDWRLLVDDEFVSAKDKLRIFLSDKEDRCYIFEENNIEYLEYGNTYILSVYDDGISLLYGYDCNGFLFTADVTDNMAEYIMAEIMKQIYPR